MRFLDRVLTRTFARPIGVFGWVGGVIMARENRRMARRSIKLMDIRPRDRVLEIGCGPGVGIHLLAHASPARTVAGVDPSRSMLEQTQTRNAMDIATGKVLLRRCAVADMPFANAAFDKAVAIRSMQLWPDACAGLREIRRVLRPGGAVVLGVGQHDRRTRAKLERLLTATGYADTSMIDVDGGLYASAHRPVAANQDATDTPRIASGWSPLTHPATRDDEVFELLSAAIFQTGFRPNVVRERWPGIRAAFAGFELASVAAWPDRRVAVLMTDPRIIRSEPTLLAVLRNARELNQQAVAHGGARACVRSPGDDEDAAVRDIAAWAHGIGAPSIRWFLRVLDA